MFALSGCSGNKSANQDPSAPKVTTDGKPATANVTREAREPGPEEKELLKKLEASLKEDTIEGHFERGQLYLMAGEKGLVAAYPLAAEDFSWILKKDPKHVGALGNRGMAYVRSGQIDEALADFKMVTEVKPDDSYGYTVYAQVLSKTGNDKQAVAVYGKAIELGGPTAEGARFNRGNAHMRLGNKDLAKKDFEVLVKSAKNPQVLQGAKMNLEALK